MILSLNPYSIEDLLKGHKMMMADLISENGQFRKGNVGVFEGERVVHRTPPAWLVPTEIENLFHWY